MNRYENSSFTKNRINAKVPKNFIDSFISIEQII